jgi:hypothetical protein
VLFAFRRFAHDPQGILTAVHQFTLVGIELVANTSQSRVGICQRLGCHAELSIAAFTDSEHRDTPGMFYDPELAFGHVQSLAHREGRT